MLYNIGPPPIGSTLDIDVFILSFNIGFPVLLSSCRLREKSLVPFSINDFSPFYFAFPGSPRFDGEFFRTPSELRFRTKYDRTGIACQCQ